MFCLIYLFFFIRNASWECRPLFGFAKQLSNLMTFTEELIMIFFHQNFMIGNLEPHAFEFI